MDMVLVEAAAASWSLAFVMLIKFRLVMAFSTKQATSALL